jgi:hypothetical protein
MYPLPEALSTRGEMRGPVDVSTQTLVPVEIERETEERKIEIIGTATASGAMTATEIVASKGIEVQIGIEVRTGIEAAKGIEVRSGIEAAIGIETVIGTGAAIGIAAIAVTIPIMDEVGDIIPDSAGV